MRCPTLAELPPPPAGKTGWPWTVESPQLPDAMPDGKPWPRISIVTPSYNQGQFIEETIRSVLLQGYPDLEYIIMDGGSTDGAIDIIRRYEPWLTHWESGQDGGQSAAIGKGFAKVTGEIQAWVNSDDGYLPSAFQRVAREAFRCRNTFVYSNYVTKTQGKADELTLAGPVREIYLGRGGLIPQHTAFWTSDFNANVDDRLVCNMDTELWFRLIPLAKRVVRIREPLAYCYSHPEQKTRSERWRLAWERDQVIIDHDHFRRMPLRVRFWRVIDRVYRFESSYLVLLDHLYSLASVHLETSRKSFYCRSPR